MVRWGPDYYIRPRCLANGNLSGRIKCIGKGAPMVPLMRPPPAEYPESCCGSSEPGRCEVLRPGDMSEGHYM